MSIKNSIIYKINKLITNHNDIQRGTVIPKNCNIQRTGIYGDVIVGKNNTIIDSTINGNVIINDGCYINHSKINGNITINNNCKLYYCEIASNIIIGRYTSLWGPNLDISTDKWEIEIGSFCSIARNVNIQTFNHNYKKITSYFIGKNLFKEFWDNEKIGKGKTVVENDVWIGAQCVILGGVTIANGAVVAANSVVLNDVPPYAIVGGTPAKIIGYRFEQNIIDLLQEIKWWNWSDNEIKMNKDLFINEITIEKLNKIKS